MVFIVVVAVRERGGREAEQEERQRWNQREQQRILDSVRGNGPNIVIVIVVNIVIVVS